MNVLEIQQLRKAFATNQVLDGLDMVVPENSVFGFVGRNGAGKTTTMKIIVGLLPADSGRITVCGEEVIYGSAKTNRHIGFLRDVPEFYGYMRPHEYLRLCGKITGLAKKEIDDRAEELLDLVGLGDVRRRIGGFSRGMKQRLGIAQALINEPRLLICDEPTSALDPIGRRQVLDILASIKGRTTVLFSTHILSDVERICDRVAVLEGGRLVLSGTISELQRQYRSNSFQIRFGDLEQAQAFGDCPELQQPAIDVQQDGDGLTIVMEDGAGDGQMLINLLAEKGITPVKFEILEPTLESLFTEVVQ